MAIQPQQLPRRKKILILVSRGGGGHKTAAEALKQILTPTYDIEINYVLEDILRPIDPLNQITRGHFTGEDLYNFLLKNHQNKLLTWMIRYGTKAYTPQRIEKIFDDYLASLPTPPDLVISPTPYINYGVAAVTHRWKIPFIIIPTDLDGSSFLSRFPTHPPYDHFQVALSYNDPDIKKTTFQNINLRSDQVLLTGFPVRPACLKKYTPEELDTIRARFNLFTSYKTVTLIMGAVGCNLIFDHVKSLAQFNPRAHRFDLQINVCVGNNQPMGNKIASYLFAQGAHLIGPHIYRLPSGLVIHLRGYTKEIIEIMAASDIIITKTGSCTVNEAIYLGKKLLLDHTRRSSARSLWWERFNIPFVEKYSLGHAFTDSSQLHMLIPSLLKYPELPDQKLDLPNFEAEIVAMIANRLN